MKKIFPLLILSFLLAGLSLFSGCEPGGEVVDIGNPNKNLPAPAYQTPAPSLSQLEGFFETLNVSLNVGGTGTTLPECQADERATQKITAGQGANTVILENFLSYSEETKKITAGYLNGQLQFSLKEAGVDLSCTGTASLESNVVFIDLSCNILKPTPLQCKIILAKTKELAPAVP